MKERTGSKLVYPRTVSDESKDVIRKMLTIEVDQRANWAELFNHKVFDKKTAIKPAVINGMDKMLKSFATPKDRNMADPQAQFTKNRQHAESVDKVPFIQPDQMKTPSPVPSKHLEEKPIDPILEHQILQDMALKEISYTYNHERNKILFLVFSVKHIQWSLTNPRFGLYAESFFQLSLLILKKAKVINDGLIHNLSNGNNIFDINAHFWNLYVASPHLAETKLLFASLSSLLQEYFDLVLFRTADNSFNVKVYERFLSVPNPDLALMDRVMLDEKAKVSELKKSDPDLIHDASHASKLTCLEKLIETSIYSEQTLKYIRSANGVHEKFQMERFYKSITQNQGVPFY